MKKKLLTSLLMSFFAIAGFAQSQYLLNESFDNDETAQTTTLPEGWTRIDQYSGSNNDYRWSVHYDEKATTMTGQHYLGVDASMFEDEKYADGQGPRVEKVLTPELDLNDDYQLSFLWKAAAASSLDKGDYDLLVNVLDLDTNTETTIFNSSNVDDVRNSGVQGDPYDKNRIWPNWGKNASTLYLSAFKGKRVKIVFVYNLKHTVGNVLYIDEVKVKKGTAPSTPQAKVDQSNYDFGSMYVGEKVYSQAFTLTNVGMSGLKVTGFEAPDGIGLVMDSANVNLSKNETAKFQLWYKAALTTPAEADAVLKTNGGDVTVHVKAAKTVVPDGYSLELFETFPPAGWSAKGWGATGYALEGDKSAFTTGSLENSDLISPRLDLSDASKPHKVMFTYYSQFDSETGDTYPNNDLSLWVSTDGGENWNQNDSIWAADYTQSNQKFNITVDLSKYTSNNVKLMWRNTAVGYDADYGAFEYASYYLDRVLLPSVYGSDGVPMATELTSPANDAKNVYPKNVEFAWKQAQFASGYKLYLGKSATSFDVLNGTDVADVTTYTVPTLDYATTYFWKVVPYNKVGDAADATVFSFTTQADQSITEFPWFEGFEGDEFPPLGWYQDNTGTTKWSHNEYHPYDGKYSLSASARTVGEKLTITSPDIKLPADKDMQVSFWWGNDMGVNLKKDTETVRTNTTTGNDGIDAGFFEIYADGQWKQLSMISEPDQDNRYWVRERFDLKPYAGKTIQLRWSYEMYNYNKSRGVSIDNIELSDANATNVTLSTTAWNAHKVNYNRSVTSENITLSNFGGNDVSIKDVALTTGNFATSLKQGDVIASGKTLNFNVTFNALTTATTDSVAVNDKLVITLSDNSKLELPVSGIALPEDILYYDFEHDNTGVAPEGFTTIDEDGRTTMEPYFWNWPNMGGRLSFFVINDNQCNSVLKGAYGHQSLMSIVSDDDDLMAKDWIVSQPLDITSTSTFSFDARNWESVNSVLPGNCPKLSVWVSETSASDINAFTQVGKTKQMELFDEKAWTHYSFDLSQYAGKKVYVALKSEVSKGLGSFYDNFEFAHVKGTSGIGSVATDADQLSGHVVVYNISGAVVAQGDASEVLSSLPSGIYVAKTATKAVKVLKK